MLSIPDNILWIPQINRTSIQQYIVISRCIGFLVVKYLATIGTNFKILDINQLVGGGFQFVKSFHFPSFDQIFHNQFETPLRMNFGLFFLTIFLLDFFQLCLDFIKVFFGQWLARSRDGKRTLHVASGGKKRGSKVGNSLLGTQFGFMKSSLHLSHQWNPHRHLRGLSNQWLFLHK